MDSSLVARKLLLATFKLIVGGHVVNAGTQTASDAPVVDNRGPNSIYDILDELTGTSTAQEE